MKKTVKANKIIVFVGTEKGKFYQVCLLPEEAQGLLDAIDSWHIGKIKCFKDELPFEIEKKGSSPSQGEREE